MHLGEQVVLSPPQADQELYNLCANLCKPGNQKRGAYSIYRDEEDLEFKDRVIKRGIWLGIPLRQGYEGCFI